MPRFWPIPTLPNDVATLWLRMQFPPQAAFMLAFDVSGAVTSPPFNHSVLQQDVNNWIHAGFQHTMCSGDGFVGGWFFYNNSVKTYSFPLNIFTGLVQAPGHRSSYVLCPCFRKESVGYSPVRIGHMFGPRLPAVYWTNGWTPTALAAYSTLTHWLEIGFASQGLVFFPTIFSPKDFATYRIGKFSLLRKPAIKYSRRDRPTYIRDYPTFPIVT